jgi:hypothetical protein
MSIVGQPVTSEIEYWHIDIYSIAALFPVLSLFHILVNLKVKEQENKPTKTGLDSYIEQNVNVFKFYVYN